MQSFFEKRSDGLNSQNRQWQENKREREGEILGNAVGGFPPCCTDRRSPPTYSTAEEVPWKDSTTTAIEKLKEDFDRQNMQHSMLSCAQPLTLNFLRAKPFKILFQKEPNTTHVLWRLPLIAKLKKAELLSPLLEASQHTVPVLLNMLALMVLSTRTRSNDGADEFV